MKFAKIPNKEFEMSVYQTTQADWIDVMPSNPSYFHHEHNLPVEQVSFHDVQEFIKKLNDKKDGYFYRLPTEEEWEYCCRAGSTTDFCFGDSEEELKEYAWTWENSDLKTHPVGQKKPNAWGLYDMHGNVWEWCDSFYFKDETDSNSYRVLRGGSWSNNARSARSAIRRSSSPGDSYHLIGFRLVREALPSEDMPNNPLPSNTLTLSDHMSLNEVKQRMWNAYKKKARREFLKIWKEVENRAIRAAMAEEKER